MIFKINHDEMRKMVVPWLDKNDKLIVELGCSNGNFASLLHKNGFRNYMGIDILKDKIKEAKNKLPGMSFICCDITENLYLLKGAITFVSFQCLEHIEKDLDVINSLRAGTKVIISVPNSPYKGHVRWFEFDGWEERFSPYIDFDCGYVIQNPKKLNRRAFLFRGEKK
jgi:SAM-dependent methyltransferase